MTNDADLTQTFRNLDFSEPPMTSTSADDLHRGQRGLRRRRITMWSSGTVALGIVAVGAAVALPNVQLSSPSLDPANGPADETVPLVEMNDAELADNFAACRDQQPNFERAEIEGAQPMFGVRAAAGAERRDVSTWLLAQDGDTWWVCELYPSGAVDESWYAMYFSAHPGGQDNLTALVELDDLGQGRYAAPVTHVTVQEADGPERNAITFNGFWFYPADADPDSPDDEVDEMGESDELDSEPYPHMDLPAGHVVRGYDAAGNLVFDSSTDSVMSDECVRDPETGFVLVYPGNGIMPEPDPETCREGVVWSVD
ncbi:hypothetical protein [Phytoactinopolyspora limicola]|uniref:hypothetical protein n=1 Tax=Phytoactinopolyspora limicola TaxID=2715536 RepID=UPI0014075F59|nr:hypothetical protein [Phytoactinopolyspora limicola]